MSGEWTAPRSGWYRFGPEPQPGDTAQEVAFDSDVIDSALDESLPSGVIAVQDDERDWWRYPLPEFTEGESP